jgi:hypothetical protein
VAGVLRVGFINIEELKNKINNKGFLYPLKTNYIFGIAESWTGLNMIAIFGRNASGMVMCVKNSISRNLLKFP